MKANEPKWADLARTSMEEFILEVRAKLPEQASIAEIEAVLLVEYQQVLRDIFQSIVDEQESTLPPPKLIRDPLDA